MKSSYGAALLLIAISTPAFADMASDIRLCAKVSDDKTRLACFDLNAKAWAEPVAAPGVFRKIAPADLAIESHKWDGLSVETALNCFYADVAEFRCFDVRSFARVRVDFSEMDPAGEGYLKAHCDTSAAADGRACFVKLHFVYGGYNREELGGLTGHVTFVHPKDGHGEIVK